MLMLFSSSAARQLHNHLSSPCIRVTTKSSSAAESSLLKALSAISRRNFGNPTFYQRAFFCSDSSGNGICEVEVEVKSRESSADSADAINAITRTSPQPEDYLTVIALPLLHRTLFPCFYMPIFVKDSKLLAALQESRKRQAPYASAFLLKHEPGTDPCVISTIQGDQGILIGHRQLRITEMGRFPHLTICLRIKHAVRQFSSSCSNIPIVADIIAKQHWSELKTHLRSANPNELLNQLLTSRADPELILRYVTWSQKELKLSHSLELTFRLLHSLVYAKKYSKIRSSLDNFVKNENYPVSSVFHAISLGGDSFCAKSLIVDMLVLAYVKHLKINLGVDAFKRAGDYGFKLSVVSCNPLLSALVRNCEIRDMEFVYKEMIKRRIDPSLISFNIVINGFCEVGKLNKASDIIEDMKFWGVSPNVITYNTLIHGYCKMGKIAKMYKADAILKEMVANGICANEITFNILIDGFCKDGNVSAAMKLLAEMQSQGLKPNVVTYNSLINGLCTNGKVGEAIALWDQMVDLHLKPNVITYNSLINGFCKNEMVKEAVDLFNDMPKHGISPNTKTYNTLIDALCKAGRMEDAFTLHNIMLGRGVCSDVSTYNCLLAGLCRKGDVEAARNLVDEMVSKDLKADLVTYNILINSLSTRGESRKGMRLLDEMSKKGLNPSHVTYNTLMEGYCREGNLRAALNVKTQMERGGKQANVVTYNVLIKGFCKKGKLEDANGLLNEMLEKGLVPNRTTYDIVREDMMEKGFVPDIEGHLYNVSVIS